MPPGGLAEAPIPPKVVPIPAEAPMVAPLPPVPLPIAALPPPALPLDPDQEPLASPKFKYNERLINDETTNDARTIATLGTDVHIMAQDEPRTKRKAAVEERGKIYSQTRFSNDVRYHHNPPPRKQQPQKTVLWTTDGHILVPIPPSQNPTRVDNQAKTRKKAEEANEPVPARKTKTNILTDSVKRVKQLTKTKRKYGPGSSKDLR